MMTVAQKTQLIVETLPAEQQAQVFAFAQHLAQEAQSGIPTHVKPGPPLSPEAYQALIDEALAEMEDGKGTDWADFKREMRSW